MRVSLIIPALNEADCLGSLLAEIPAGLIQQVIVVDNGSTDATAAVAAASGALVITEPRRGYGFACAAGVRAATGDAIAFMDGDGSFVPGELAALLAPLSANQADFVLGTRTKGGMTPGSMPPHQQFGNWLVAALLRWMYHVQLSDLGPFRVIRRDLLDTLDLRERTYGWPVEMMIKAARQHARIVEVPVRYRPRFAGESKVGGTLRGTLLATYRILSVTFRSRV
ncbi:MAG: glycosyltransferase family 2 protein [Roseiflexaceae bacterium]|nr:glycosyltransferase family 2 protein [Roseiflexaceae bacterium]